MSTITLEAQLRDKKAGKPGQLRRNGIIPVTVYGKKQSPFSLAVLERNLEATLSHGGATQLVEVSVQDAGRHNILIREVQRHPVTHRLMHADFYAVAMDEKQHVSVPVEGVGKPLALSSGLMVLQNHDALTVEVLPADIPGVIEVDLTQLSMEHPIRVSDLPTLPGVRYLIDPEEHIFSLVLTRAGAQEAEEAEAAGAEPELVRRPKEGEE
jgi:large subunit ribosomal protein L25